MSQALLQVK